MKRQTFPCRYCNPDAAVKCCVQCGGTGKIVRKVSGYAEKRANMLKVQDLSPTHNKKPAKVSLTQASREVRLRLEAMRQAS